MDNLTTLKYHAYVQVAQDLAGKAATFETAAAILPATLAPVGAHNRALAEAYDAMASIARGMATDVEELAKREEAAAALRAKLDTNSLD